MSSQSIGSDVGWPDPWLTCTGHRVVYRPWIRESPVRRSDGTRTWCTCAGSAIIERSIVRPGSSVTVAVAVAEAVAFLTPGPEGHRVVLDLIAVGINVSATRCFKPRLHWAKLLAQCDRHSRLIAGWCVEHSLLASAKWTTGLPRVTTVGTPWLVYWTASKIALAGKTTM